MANLFLLHLHATWGKKQNKKQQQQKRTPVIQPCATTK